MDVNSDLREERTATDVQACSSATLASSGLMKQLQCGIRPESAQMNANPGSSTLIAAPASHLVTPTPSLEPDRRCYSRERKYKQVSTTCRT